MNKSHILPLILIIIDIGAAIGYLPSAEYKRVIYWLSAASLTYCVTF
jgi:hypothetical protein